MLSLRELRETLQVNFFAAAELANWLCGAVSEAASGATSDRALSSTTRVVLVSSMGRWHGMHYSGGYNASKAALSIWGESLDMELRQRGNRRFTVTDRRTGNLRVGDDAIVAAHPRAVRIATAGCASASSPARSPVDRQFGRHGGSRC